MFSYLNKMKIKLKQIFIFLSVFSISLFTFLILADRNATKHMDIDSLPHIRPGNIENSFFLENITELVNF